MKKIIAVGLVIVLAFLMVACNANSEKNAAEGTEKNTVDVVESTEQASQEIETTETEAKVSKVDLDALLAVEAKDEFPISVQETVLVPGMYDDGTSLQDLNGEDGIGVVVKNNSGVTISEVEFLVLCTNGKSQTVGLGGLESPSFWYGEYTFSKDVKYMGVNSLNFENGTEMKCGIQCRLGEIENVNIIVYKYIDNNGKEVINENVYNWLPLTLEV